MDLVATILRWELKHRVGNRFKSSSSGELLTAAASGGYTTWNTNNADFVNAFSMFGYMGGYRFLFELMKFFMVGMFQRECLLLHGHGL